MTKSKIKILCFLLIGKCLFAFAQNYEVADIDCAVGTGGKELLTARLRRPDGFRGTPIFADDRGQSPKESLPSLLPQDVFDDSPCQIIPDPGDNSGRVFKLRITDFSQCGIMKRNGFINVRVWFPQLPGVVMLSDQEVIIMCKPPAATVMQSKTAGFAGSIPSGARISGIVEESPGRLEYEVALYRETASTASSLAARSNPTAYITGADSHELPVDQAVPIGTRLQLRAKINPDSAWKHAKLMEVSVSPDPKNALAEGSVALVRDGCRNPELASIIPKQPYRYKDRSNEVVLDFEAFLLSNMADRSTLWLHTQIKACMEPGDCHSEFCMDVFQPSGHGRRRRRRNLEDLPTPTSSMSLSKSNATSMEYSSPLSQHWTAYADEIVLDNAQGHLDLDQENSSRLHALNELLSSLNRKRVSGVGANLTRESPLTSGNVHKEEIGETHRSRLRKQQHQQQQQHPAVDPAHGGLAGESTKFGDNIGFSVIMPSDYYRSTNVLSSSYECQAWATATLFSLLMAVVAALAACLARRRFKKFGAKEKSCYPAFIGPNNPNISVVRNKDLQVKVFPDPTKLSDHKFARDPSVYRP